MFCGITIGDFPYGGTLAMDKAIISVIVVLFGMFAVWCLMASQKCSGCGHNEEDHVCGVNGDECMMCECKEYR